MPRTRPFPAILQDSKHVITVEETKEETNQHAPRCRGFRWFEADYYKRLKSEQIDSSCPPTTKMQDCRILYLLLLLSVAENLPLVGASESGIVGGRVAKPHSRPYMASLQIHGHHICGGILIRDDYVLTAAHCKKDSQPLTVVLGAHDLSKKEKSQQRLTVKNYRKHDNFTGGQENDVMLLKLKTKAQLNKYVETINLPKKNKETLANIRCEVAGWGHTGVDKRISNVLKEASEETQFKGECKYIWREYFNPTQMICTKFTKKSGGICQGDSGGPLICNNKLLGLTAFTQEENCHNPKFPHVFMKISSFLPWIQTVMKE